MGGGSAKTPPVIEKIGKTPSLSGEAGPPLRRAKRAGKFLGFFREFSEISGKFGIFGEFSLNLTGFSLI